MKPWFVYILQCADNSLYTGTTIDIASRFAAHKTGKGAKFTRSRGAKKILYSEKFSAKSDAMKREREIKGLSRKEKLALISYS
ncbi:MAG: GIY-YIG nuclease family protein [Pseudomonadota bacterium]